MGQKVGSVGMSYAAVNAHRGVEEAAPSLFGRMNDQLSTNSDDR